MTKKKRKIRDKMPRKMKKRLKRLILFFTVCGEEFKKEQERRSHGNNSRN